MNFIRVSTALSESSSIHSDGLLQMARDISGLEPMPYNILAPVSLKEEVWLEESECLLEVTEGWESKYKQNAYFGRLISVGQMRILFIREDDCVRFLVVSKHCII